MEAMNPVEAWLEDSKKMSNWTASDPDGIPGYWLKCFRGMASELQGKMLKALDGSEQIPVWLVHGRTVLIPKNENPTGHRPITCLNTIYTSCTQEC